MKKQRVINSRQLSTQSLQRSPHSERRQALWLCLTDLLSCFQQLPLPCSVLHLPQTPINIPIPSYHARKVHFSCCNFFPYVTWLEKKKEDRSKLGHIISTHTFWDPNTQQTSHLLIRFWKERGEFVFVWGGGSGERERERETRRHFDIISSLYRLRIWFIAKH